MIRLIIMGLFAATIGSVASLVSNNASAAQAAPQPSASAVPAQMVQYYVQPRHYDDDWERRRYWREQRRARDDARIAEAARREAYRIEQERMQRRAWRHAERQRYGY